MRESAKHARLSVGPAAVACALAIAACGSSGNAPAAGTSSNHASFLKFSQCMRAHGVTNFPDPSPGGGIHIALGSGPDPQSPAFRSAQQSCKHLLPGGGPRTTVSESTKLTLLRQAECMRTHGVPDFPDPRFPKGGGIETFIGPGLNPNAPAFQRALKACGGGNGVAIGG